MNYNLVVLIHEVNTSFNWAITVTKNILNYAGLYSVDNCGNIYSMYKNKIKKLKHNLVAGYYRVRLFKNGIYKSFLISRLVAHAFILNPENKPEVNHKDGNKLNNYYKNLEWVTRKENMQHRIKKLNITTAGENNGRAKITKNDVKKIKTIYANGNTSHKKLGKLYNISDTAIRYIIIGKTWGGRFVQKGKFC